MAVCERIRAQSFFRGHREIQFAVVCDVTRLLFLPFYKTVMFPREIQNIYDTYITASLELTQLGQIVLSADMGQFIPNHNDRIYIVKALLMQGGYLTVPPNFKYRNE